MSEPNFDPSEGDWEDFSGSEEPTWTENQWRRYLQGADRETARFLSIYNSIKEKPNHLDEAAALMGWDADDISITDEFGPDFIADGRGSAGEGDFDDLDPYTLHKHPVHIVSQALYRYLTESWDHFLAHNEGNGGLPSAADCWRYARSLHRGEMSSVLAIQALDLGDLGLAICHFKNGLSALNATLAVMDRLSHSDGEFLGAFQHEARIRIFDLRELWIRVMGDCRAEHQRRLRDGD